MAELVGYRLWSLGRYDAAVLSQQIEHGEIRGGAAIRETMAFQICDCTAGQALAKLVQQSGFANPWLSRNPYHLSLALLHLRQGRVQYCQLSLPTHKATAWGPPEPRVCGMPQHGICSRLPHSFST